MPVANLSRNAAQFCILATGPIVHESGMVPSRLVLRRQYASYVTHKQGLRGSGDKIHASFSSGNYFMCHNGGPDKALVMAVADFCKRLTEQVAGHTAEQLLPM